MAPYITILVDHLVQSDRHGLKHDGNPYFGYGNLMYPCFQGFFESYNPTGYVPSFPGVSIIPPR